MKQTAVEWLYGKWSEQGTLYFSDLNQAKQMEKEQREKDLESGFHVGRLYQGREGDTTLEELKERTFKSDKDFSCVQFILDNKTSSATKCICGREKWQHTTFKSE